MKFFLLLIFFALSARVLGGGQAGYSASAYSGCPPLVVNFADTTPGATSWYWNFGNGNISTKPTPSASFLNTGTYDVKLIVTTAHGKDTVTKNVRVFKVPTVDFTTDKTLACSGAPINFQNLVTPGDAPVVYYGWGFGNGIAHSDSNTTYAYPQAGTYNITLVVQDTNGCAANKTKANYITVLPSPQAAFTASPMVSCDSEKLVTFTNQSSGTGLTYSWILSDSATSTLQNPTYTYHEQTQTVV
jgi:PKD repeat protein